MHKLLLLIIILSISVLGFGQIAFYKVFTNNGADFGQGVVQLPDSSYVITGSSSSFGEESSQAFLLKIDSLGNFVWSNHYGGSEIESGRRVLYRENYGFLISGFTNSFGNGGFDFYLAKVDENANLEWEKAYGNEGWEKVHDAALTIDTGIIMVGETSSNETDNLDIYIVRTNSAGDTLWTKTIGGVGDDYASSINQYDDSTFVIGGRMYLEDSLQTKAYLMYLKDDGTVFWENTYGTNGDYWINDLCFENNEIVSVGGADRYLGDSLDPAYFRADMSGIQQSLSVSAGLGQRDNRLVTRFGSSNGVYIVLRFDDQWASPGGSDILISRWNVPLNWQSNFIVYHDEPDIEGDIIGTSDGGVIFVGYVTGTVSGGHELAVVKIGAGDTFPAYPEIVDNLVDISEEQVSDLLFYPNPVSEELKIRTENAAYTQVRLYDAQGAQLFEDEFSFQKQVDVSQMAEGYYIVEMRGASVLPVRKKIVVRR